MFSIESEYLACVVVVLSIFFLCALRLREFAEFSVALWNSYVRR